MSNAQEVYVERDLEHVTGKIVQWHHDKNIIEGATDQSQCNKMLEELIELFCACHPEVEPEELVKLFVENTLMLHAQGKFKTVTKEEALDAKVDAVGDQVVVGINILERNGVSLQTCLNSVYDEISKRTGSIVNGSFVKDE